MTFIPCNRRDFAVRLAALLSGLGAAGTAFAYSEASRTEPLAAGDEVSHSAEAIHQEVVFKADPKRVYDALTDQKQFAKVVELSAAGMSLGKAPTEISSEAGGAFSLFGGHIVGRHIELVPGQRLVQAWRIGNWGPGVYSIAKFDLAAQDSGTKLSFDHTGFPQGQGQHLAEGWQTNYWEPLAKYLAQIKRALDDKVDGRRSRKPLPTRYPD
ncbi:MAG TPA: SRPBCC domain-containing protein [Candidatus Angelobacter sp.]